MSENIDRLMATLQAIPLEDFTDEMHKVISYIELKRREFRSSPSIEAARLAALKEHNKKLEKRLKTKKSMEKNIRDAVMNGTIVLRKGSFLKLVGTRDGHGLRVFEGMNGNQIACWKLESWNIQWLQPANTELFEYEKKFYRRSHEVVSSDAGRLRKLLAMNIFESDRSFKKWDNTFYTVRFRVLVNHTNYAETHG